MAKNTVITIHPKYVKKYKCPYCEKRLERGKLIDHIDKQHSDMIPENYSSTRVVFNLINKKTQGRCVICGKETDWNEDKARYERICNRPQCKKAYIDQTADRLYKKHGKTKQDFLNDPKFQEKMLLNRSISGKYKFRDGGVLPYVGSYEKNFLQFMDQFFHVKSSDLIAPGPVIDYKFNGKTHQWITDFYYEPYNLVFDIKDGGSNPNTREMNEYRAKQIAKEKAIKDMKQYNYIRLTDNQFDQMIELMLELKENLIDTPVNTTRKVIIRVNEGYIKPDEDIYYNKDKFDSGEINLCFITGLSGSGKSTMGRNMSSKNIEHYELDDVILNDNFTMENFKEYGGLIYSFFKGPGKSFKLIKNDDTHNNKVFEDHEEYEKEITSLFVKHAIAYAKSHKNTKFVCDGIWIFMFIKPNILENCAVYIKGTSSLKSGYRALKRDVENDKQYNPNEPKLKKFKRYLGRLKEDIFYAKENQKELKSFRKYFDKQTIDESVLYESNNKFKYESLSTDKEIKEFKVNFRKTFHADDDMSDSNIKKSMKRIMCNNKLIGYIGFSKYDIKGKKYLGIGNFMILPEYQKSGYGSSVIDDIINKKKNTYYEIYCYVDKYNKNAINFYKKIANVNTSTLTEYGYYVTLYRKSVTESVLYESDKNIENCKIDDMKEVISSLDDDSFKNFRFKNIIYCDIRYRSEKPIAFIVIKPKLIENITVGFVSLAVNPKYQNQDIEKFLVEKAVIWFKGERGLDFLQWDSLQDNDTSNELIDDFEYGKFIAKSPDEYINLYATESVSSNINTIIFDIGAVLVQQVPLEISLRQENPKFIPEELIDQLVKIWCSSGTEQGSLEEQITTACIKASEYGIKGPLKQYMKYIALESLRNIERCDYTIPMLRSLKMAGYKLYILSNWGKWHFEELQKRNEFREFLQYFDGGIVSYQVGLKKPDRKIYEILIEKYDIDPTSAVFYDDKPENIQAAKEVGLNAVVFDRSIADTIINKKDFVLTESEINYLEKYVL